MSLRTTLVLLVLVALAGAAIWWFTRGEHQPGPDSGRLLPGLQTTEITTITLESERKDTELKSPVTLARGNGAEWTARVGEEAEGERGIAAG